MYVCVRARARARVCVVCVVCVCVCVCVCVWSTVFWLTDRERSAGISISRDTEQHVHLSVV